MLHLLLLLPDLYVWIVAEVTGFHCIRREATQHNSFLFRAGGSEKQAKKGDKGKNNKGEIQMEEPTFVTLEYYRSANESTGFRQP